MAKMIDCPRCGQHRPHNANGLCTPCYKAQQRASTPEGICAGCGQQRRIIHAARQFCAACKTVFYRDGLDAVAPAAAKRNAPKLTMEVLEDEWEYLVDFDGRDLAFRHLARVYSLDVATVQAAVREYEQQFQKRSA